MRAGVNACVRACTRIVYIRATRYSLISLAVSWSRYGHGSRGAGRGALIKSMRRSAFDWFTRYVGMRQQTFTIPVAVNAFFPNATRRKRRMHSTEAEKTLPLFYCRGQVCRGQMVWGTDGRGNSTKTECFLELCRYAENGDKLVTKNTWCDGIHFVTEISVDIIVLMLADWRLRTFRRDRIHSASEISSMQRFLGYAGWLRLRMLDSNRVSITFLCSRTKNLEDNGVETEKRAR